MSRKWNTPTAAESSAKKRRLATTSDSLATNSNTESVRSRTWSQSRQVTRTNTSQRAHDDLEQPLALHLLVAEANLDPAANTSHPASPGATESYTSLYSADETISDVVIRPTLNNIVVDMPGAATQSFVPEYLPTLSPVLAANHITSAPTLSRPLPFQYLPSHTATARNRPKKPTMAFKYAIYRIVNNNDYSSWVKWSDNGDQLLIGNWEFFVDILVDMGFSMSGRTSAMRNFYSHGFKLKSDGRHRIPDKNGVVWTVLQHDKFIRDKPELLKEIIRTVSPRKN
ncbi:hypothetical protein GGI03_000832 [Coemansia sp. RSA 2337]|nr:hypothetical protein GGI08_003134 [Coemansia sp. S2]KAJ2348209.1 hypothetical protein GGH92_002905 [Coemansia sp. RSA 2673]KAJ2468705.1 hypothetical protein GGI03_000832 [Coemansia sp. RSA 2337]